MSKFKWKNEHGHFPYIIIVFEWSMQDMIFFLLLFFWRKKNSVGIICFSAVIVGAVSWCCYNMYNAVKCLAISYFELSWNIFSSVFSVIQFFILFYFIFHFSVSSENELNSLDFLLLLLLQLLLLLYLCSCRNGIFVKNPNKIADFCTFCSGYCFISFQLFIFIAFLLFSSSFESAILDTIYIV